MSRDNVAAIAALMRLVGQSKQADSLLNAGGSVKDKIVGDFLDGLKCDNNTLADISRCVVGFLGDK